MARFLWFLGIAACTEIGLDDSVDQSGLSSVRWTLDWDLEGIETSARGWCTVTDTGAEVCVTSGSVVSAMTSLVQCDDVVSRAGWTSWLPVSTAVAGHPGDGDPSAWYAGQVEDLAFPTAVSVGDMELWDDVYCRAHWATDAGWEDASLRLTGWVTLPDGSRAPLDLQTDLAWASLQDVAALSVGPSGAHPVEVRVIRQLAPLFDGIDWSGDLEDLDRDVLRNLAESIRFEVVALDS